MTHEEYRLEENVKGWNILFSILFVGLVTFGFFNLRNNYLLPNELPLLDFFILILATFRLVRLFTYDHITSFIREALLDVKRVRYAESGEEQIERVLSQNSLKRTLDRLISCPWCVGVWMALLTVSAYLIFPETWIILLVLAVAGMGSVLQILANMFGWMAERAKQAVQNK